MVFIDLERGVLRVQLQLSAAVSAFLFLSFSSVKQTLPSAKFQSFHTRAKVSKVIAKGREGSSGRDQKRGFSRGVLFRSCFLQFLCHLSNISVILKVHFTSQLPLFLLLRYFVLRDFEVSLFWKGCVIWTHWEDFFKYYLQFLSIYLRLHHRCFLNEFVMIYFIEV